MKPTALSLALALLAATGGGARLSAGIRSVRSSGSGAEAYVVIDLPRRGFDEPLQGRLFRIGPAGLAPLAVDPNLLNPNLLFAEPSSDASVLTYTIYVPCGGDPGALCGRVVQSASLLLPNPSGITSVETGSGRISGNGRYVAYVAGTAISLFTFITRKDLLTGARRDLS